MEKSQSDTGMQSYHMHEFNEDQKAEIQAGRDAGLDVSCYANPKFLAIQMRQIRMGLLDGMDVRDYAKPEYDWFQMEEIRKGIRDGVNYRLYARPEIDYTRMRQVRKGLKQNIDISQYVHLEANILEELRKAEKSGVSIMEFIEEGYEVRQLEEIRNALEKHIDIKPYISTELVGASIREVALGLEEGLPVSVYGTIEYNWRQMREIRMGMERRLDVSLYQNYLFSWQQMREIRLGMEEGLEVDSYRRFMYTDSEMRRIREELLLEEAKSIISYGNSEINGEILVFISQDEMEACIEVKCDESVELSVRDIMEGLRRNGVCQGVIKSEVESLVKEKKYNRTIVIARGQPAEQGEDGFYEFFFNTKLDRTPKILADGSADFRNIQWFETVKAGDKIVYYHAAGFGKAGYTVKGKFIRAKKGIEKKTLSGTGFRLHEDGRTYYAAIDGKIELVEESRIEISRICVFDDVNLATGDIRFDGTVYIKGNVGRGVTIYATEGIVVDGYVESAKLQCGGDALLRHGANGQGIMEVKGNVTGQFFENVKIVAGGDISGQYFLNCDLCTEGLILTQGARGLIAGGNARAAKGISAYTIGNKVGLRTILNVGVDKQILGDLRRVEGKIETVEKEMLILNHSYNDFRKKYSAEVRNSMELYLKIENAIYTKELQKNELNTEKQRLAQAIKERMGAQVVVNGILYEGTGIIIDNVMWQAFMIREARIRCHNKKIVVEGN